ncbi:MAG: cell wall-active antibiotics response protein [Candidatus Marinimicrobia bacterium]|nr:cell wall-active antibiotics response protein [Candidatus Neomarinimicrobiota bacterium]MCF7839349.1 cell wall-active antibiotics response protein [Candidatus Neomarinimicrobiota bacterium]MCF7902175.1 cell wall-active antibiotics response protein [Candidatus Neomarinimicrobiota bacterium]
MRSQKTLGIIFLIVGVLFLADTLNWLRVGDIIGTWWPLIIILFGLRRLAVPAASTVNAWFFIIIGAVLQLAELNVLDINQIFYYWPVLLIAFGVYLLITGGRPPFFRGRFSGKAKNDDDILDVFSIFGGGLRASTSQNFKGGSAATIMGGVDIDLTGAKISPEGAALEVTCIMGGGKIIIPADWNVSISSLPIMGGVDHEKTHGSAAPGADAPTLQVHATAIMGGLKIISV